MCIIHSVATTLQTLLGPTLDRIGRSTGVIRRRRKFTGASLLKAVVLTVMKSPRADVDEFVATAVELGVIVSPRAVEKRFTAKLVAFLRVGLEHVLQAAIDADQVPLPLLRRFTAVEIGDSTTITLPDRYADEFPGCGGKSGSGKAAVKIQAVWELLKGRLTKFQIQAGRCSDAKSEAPEAPVVPGSLTIRDLGYFRLDRFQELARAGAYWISRWQQGTAVFDEGGQPLDLLSYVRGHRGGCPIDMPISLGARERLACRLIVLRVPQEMAARRRQKAYERASKHGTTPGEEQLAWCEWTTFVTNCPPELLSWKEVVVLYRARWQIELMFKLWKSHNHLASYREGWSAEERMAVFWAKLIGVLIQHWLLLMSVGSDLSRSYWKAARRIRGWIQTLTLALEDHAALVRLLEIMAREIQAIAKRKKQKKSPSEFQLLADPELLNWQC